LGREAGMRAATLFSLCRQASGFKKIEREFFTRKKFFSDIVSTPNIKGWIWISAFNI